MLRIETEQVIPVPQVKGPKPLYPFMKMEVGEHFFVRCKKKNPTDEDMDKLCATLRSHCHNWQKPDRRKRWGMEDCVFKVNKHKRDGEYATDIQGRIGIRVFREE